MTIHDTFAGAQYTARIANLANDMGMKLQVGDDFEEYADLVRSYRPEQPLGEPFDPEKQRISRQNGFWVTGWNARGEMVHTQAIRRLRLGGTLADYLSAHFRQFPPSGVALDKSRSVYTPGPGAQRITGITCYHGEAWLKGGNAGFRGTGIAGILARFAMTSAVLRWSPDFIFCFVPEGLAYRGLIEREGYMHAEPGALCWRLQDGGQLRGFMGWMGRDDLTHLMKISPEVLLAA